MRDKAFAMRLSGTAAGAIMLILAAGWPVEAAGDTAAHDLAEKFAQEAAKGDAQAPRRVENEKRKADEHLRKAKEDWRKVEEAEMLARARAEAEQRRVEMLQAREEAERTDQQRKAEEERRLAEIRKAEEEARAAEALRQAETLQRAQEERGLAEAEARRKAEQEARVAEELRQAEAARRADEMRLQAEAQHKAEAERLAAGQRAEEIARATQARRTAEEHEQRARLEAEREAEAQRLAERLQSARQARAVRTAGGGSAANAEGTAEQGSPTVTGSARHQLTSEGPPRDEPEEFARHVTVLLLMQPGDRGIRRNNKSADPVLCSYHDCYVSNGPDHAASLLPARKALGFLRTWGRRAGACNNSLGCVFRGVDLARLDRLVMPVDMRVVRHDRREMREIMATSKCHLERGRLACTDTIHSDDYMMWIVPESLAVKAGADALERALADGLPTGQTALAPSRTF